MKRFEIKLLLLVALIVTTFQRPASAEINAIEVERSIRRGIAYLRKTQLDNGGWEEFNGNHPCGLTALCTLALLNAGVPKDDPAIAQAMKYLRAITVKDTYSISLQTLVYCHYGAAGDLPRIRENAQWLSKSQTTGGGWNYGRGTGRPDPSNTQFAVLALGAAQDIGVAVDPIVFQRTVNYWEKGQSDDGGWGYSIGSLSSPPTGSMTCAGIGSLVIAKGRLGESTSSVGENGIRCCGGDSDQRDPVQAGLAWLEERFQVNANTNAAQRTYFYYMYALERTGRLTGKRFFGQHDWYREGAEKLLSLQDQFQGYWSGAKNWEEPTVATSFALLFLAKGKRQVVIGDLDTNAPANPVARREWKPHPDALRQLIRHVERSWGRDLTWQSVRLENAALTDLLQTPVLLISGQDALQLADDRSEMLKQYTEQGGTILFEACGGDGCGDASAFNQSVSKLCNQWYPDAPLERLPASHPIWTADRTVKADLLPKDFWVYGVQACCRTPIFYVPKSISCRWELGDHLMKADDDEDPFRGEIEQCVRIGQNLVSYATGRELKDKLDQRLVLQASVLDRTERGTTRIAWMDVNAGGADARRALPNVASIIRNQAEVAISVPSESVGIDDKSLSEVSLLWLHGRKSFQLTAPQRAALRKFIDNGGVILGNAICGNEAFANSFRTEINAILKDAPLRSLPADHPALSTDYLGYDLSKVTIRRSIREGDGIDVLKQVGPPRLEYSQSPDGLVSVVFSPLDLSCALESTNSVQCPGYDTQDAAKIVTNIVQMILHQ